MSILLTLLALQAAPAQAQPAESEIVVIATKLKGWRGDWRSHKGKFTCKTKVSTGDKEIDAIGCNAMTVCIAPIAPQMEAIADSALDKAAKNQKLNDLAKSVFPCVDQTRRDGIAELAARRAGG